MHDKRYTDYLNSFEWKYKRQLKAKKAHYTCEICGKVVKQGYHIHHKTYEHFGHEPLDDLEFLCEDCHWGLHYGKKKVEAIKKEIREEKQDHPCGHCRSRIISDKYYNGKEEYSCAIWGKHFRTSCKKYKSRYANKRCTNCLYSVKVIYPAVKKETQYGLYCTKIKGSANEVCNLYRKGEKKEFKGTNQFKLKEV